MDAVTSHTGREFTNVVEPQALLVSPCGINGYAETLLDSVDEVMALTSPSAWVIELVYGSLGVDPFQEVAARLLGDWSWFADCVDLWRMTGEAYQAIATNVRRGNDLLDATWDGNAADAAFVYFRDLRTYLQSIDRALQRCSQEYEGIALKVWYTVRGIGVLLQTMIDFALTAAIAAAAATATVATGVGAIVAAAVAAAALTKVGQTWKLTSSMLSGLEIWIFGFGGMLAQISSDIEALPRPRPGTAAADASGGDWSARGHRF